MQFTQRLSLGLERREGTQICVHLTVTAVSDDLDLKY
jgi:hypothetical protein